MIISHEYKCIFVHVPRTGGGTMRRFLSKNNVLNQYIFEEHPVLKNKKAYLYNNTFFQAPYHLPLNFIHKHHPEDFKDYCKFGVIRNPYERFISAFYFRSKRKVENFESFFDSLDVNKTREYIKSTYIPTLDENSIRGVQVVTPQYKFLCNEKDQIIADKIYNTEKLIDVFSEVTKDLQIPNVEFDNISNKHIGYKPKFDKKLLLDEEIMNWIYNRYRKDFDIFGFNKNYSL